LAFLRDFKYPLVSFVNDQFDNAEELFIADNDKNKTMKYVPQATMPRLFSVMQ